MCRRLAAMWLWAALLVSCGQRAQPGEQARPRKVAAVASGAGSEVAQMAPAPSLAMPASAAPPAVAGPVATAWPVGKTVSTKQQAGPEQWLKELDPETSESCRQFLKTPYAVSDAPTQAELLGLADCDAEASYYGIGQAVDFERARKCAFTRAEPARDAVMGGAEVLMMIYANGRGVPKNFELAARFACTVGGAPAEINGRLSRLLAARASGDLDGTMDLCDDITSGYMSGYCAAHGERIDAVPRNARKRAATTRMPTAEVKALESTAARFFDTRSTWEVDLAGTMRAVFSIEERAKLEDALVATLEHLQDRGFVPPHADLKPLESELSTLMARVARAKEQPTAMVGSVTPAGIRKTQKQWLPYRDSLLALVRKVRPAAELDDWRATILRARLEQLREL